MRVSPTIAPLLHVVRRAAEREEAQRRVASTYRGPRRRRATRPRSFGAVARRLVDSREKSTVCEYETASTTIATAR
jgi:hypothetical protein